MLAFLLLVIAIIAYGSLYPFHFEPMARAAWPLDALRQGWPDSFNRFVFRDILLNIFIYLPLGFAAAMLFLRRRPRMFAVIAATALGFAVSASMELLQMFEPMRDPSTLDILDNTVGGALGATIALLGEPYFRELTKGSVRGFRVAGAFLLVIWALQEFYPLVPALGHTHVLEELRGLWHNLHVPAVVTWLGVAEWFGVGVALDAIFERTQRAWLAGLMAFALACQFVIQDRVISIDQIVAAAIAIALWNVAPSAKRARWTMWLLGSAILLRQLQPFHLLATPQAFSWIPFGSTLISNREGGLGIISRKAFDYGALVFALRFEGVSWARAGFGVAIPLLITEAIQTHLPGRSPEITDPLLALMMMSVLWIATLRKAAA